MPSHEYQSRPVTITAVQIDDDAELTRTRMIEAFGDAADQITVDTRPATADDDGPRIVTDVYMHTIQGRAAAAKPGEWIAQEHADLHRFYPIADEAMRTRYRVPKRARA